MAHTLEGFAADCRRALKENPGRAGREKVRALVEDVLKDKNFIAAHIGDGVPERKVIYEDKDLGFCILAHVFNGAKESQPHDHGPSWAIYGQAEGETEMSDWEVAEAARDGKPAKVRQARTYTLKPGMAHIYHEGDVHSPRRAGSTRLLRIEGTNMDTVKRSAYEKA
jgi:hypothetical protein